ncbi:MAG: topoisomerase C-terminal repeat-containing protein, partial [Elainella sp.]
QDLTPGDLDPAQVEVLLRQKTEGPDKIGFHPETGEPIYQRIGPYGPYVQLGDETEANPKPKRASLPKGVNPQEVSLETAVGLLALPRLLGNHPETGAKIQANLGRFGPYVVHDQGKEGKDYRSLKKEDDVLTVTLERALELLAEPKAGRGRSKTAAKPLRELGPHPEDGEPVNIYDGPYGPYLKHSKVNASLPEGQTVEAIQMDVAVQALAEKAGSKKAGRTTKAAKATGKATGKTTGKATGKTAKATATGETASKTTSKTAKTTAKPPKAETSGKTTASKTSKTSRSAAKSTGTRSTGAKSTGKAAAKTAKLSPAEEAE